MSARLERQSEARGVVALLRASVLLLCFPLLSLAHDLPDEIIVQAFVKPEGQRVHFLVRLPLGLLLNMDLPKRGPGYLELAHMEEPLRLASAAAAEELALFENDTRLRPLKSESRISLPSDKSFASYEEAIAHLRGPRLPESTNVFWNQGFVDIHLEYPIQSDRSDFFLQIGVVPGVGDRLHTVARFIPPEGPSRAYQLLGATGRVALDPRWHQAAAVFVQSGFWHILDGFDHLLFLFCLVIPLRRLRSLLIVVTAFTLAHSLTLIASAHDLAPKAPWFPTLVETLIASSIVYTAVENIVGVGLRRRWLIALAFGLVHGFGFSFALRENLQLAGSHLLLSLLSFNLGVEIGQVAVLLLLIPAIELLVRHVVPERIGVILLSAFAAHTGWHWMSERGRELSRYEWSFPDAASVLWLAPWVLAALLAAGGLWLILSRFIRRPASGRTATGSLHS